MAAMPGLTTAQAAVNNQTGTTISNIVPAGGVISLGVVVEMFRSWGFPPTAISLEITLTGIWNSFMKLASSTAPFSSKPTTDAGWRNRYTSEVPRRALKLRTGAEALSRLVRPASAKGNFRSAVTRANRLRGARGAHRRGNVH